MNSRDEILKNIREALSDRPEVELPPMPELWPGAKPSPSDMIARFQAELETLSGELVRCPTMSDAKKELAALLKEIGAEKIGAIDCPDLRELLSEVNADRMEWGEEPRVPEELESLSTGVVIADHLLSDTGSCMVAADTPHARLMCYLPPVCVVLAKVSQLRPNIQGAWDDVARRTRNADTRGEFVFISGPSRTADIEKILILGVHGPKRLIVLLVG